MAQQAQRKEPENSIKCKLDIVNQNLEKVIQATKCLDLMKTQEGK